MSSAKVKKWEIVLYLISIMGLTGNNLSFGLVVRRFDVLPGCFQEVARRMEIKAMPTFVLMRNGEIVDKLVGANPEEIRKRVDSFVQSIHVHVA